MAQKLLKHEVKKGSAFMPGRLAYKLILGNQKSARIHLSLHRSVYQSSSLEQSAANTEELSQHRFISPLKTASGGSVSSATLTSSKLNELIEVSLPGRIYFLPLFKRDNIQPSTDTILSSRNSFSSGEKSYGTRHSPVTGLHSVSMKAPFSRSADLKILQYASTSAMSPGTGPIQGKFEVSRDFTAFKRSKVNDVRRTVHNKEQTGFIAGALRSFRRSSSFSRLLGVPRNSRNWLKAREKLTSV
ncbi:hypothetical protein Bca4012_038748 [Brassica carinata]